MDELEFEQTITFNDVNLLIDLYEYVGWLHDDYLGIQAQLVWQ